MRKYKRTIVSSVVATMLTLSLVACGTDDSTAGQTQGDGSGTNAAANAGASDTIEGVSAGTYTTLVGDKKVTYKAAYLIDGTDVTVDSGTYASVASDEAVFLVVNGGNLTISGATVNKSGDASKNSTRNPADVADDYNFYGTNSAIVVVGEESTVDISQTQINTTSSGSNAIVATDSGKAEAEEVVISTTGNSARGLHATYGGSIVGSTLEITTTGAHSAALATDRGSGSVLVTGEVPDDNTFTTSGQGSPLIYSTGGIDASGVNGTAEASQAIVVEGKNSATLSNAKVSAGGSDAVMLYQSTSGDAADADATAKATTLTLKDATIAYTGSGPQLFVTNTSAKATFTNSTFDSSSASELIKADSGQWGKSGSNGGVLALTTDKSRLVGAVNAGNGSSVTMNLTDNSKLVGGTSGTVTVTPDGTSSHDS